MITRRSVLGWALASAAQRGFSQEAKKQPSTAPARPIDAPIEIRVPAPPTAFRAGGKTHLVYELHLTNFGRSDFLLTRLEALSPEHTVLGSYTGQELAGIVARPGQQVKEPLRIGAGLRAVAFVWVALEAGKETPAHLEHRLGWKLADDPADSPFDCATISVVQQPVAIRAPLRGAGWLAANGPSNDSGHRRAAIPVGGGIYIAQRFAIDWVQLRDDGLTFTGDRLDNKNYRAYGSDVLAVADATVVTVKDGIPENVPGITSRAVPITLETVGGNHVILDLGGGRYGFYAHLQPGKIRVKTGDRVQVGQVIALLGNSGNSTEPHLHFHVCDRNSPLASEGLPYHLETFDVLGKGFGWKPSAAPPAEARIKEQPLQNTVVRFS